MAKSSDNFALPLEEDGLNSVDREQVPHRRYKTKSDFIDFALNVEPLLFDVPYNSIDLEIDCDLSFDQFYAIDAVFLRINELCLFNYAEFNSLLRKCDVGLPELSDLCSRIHSGNRHLLNRLMLAMGVRAEPEDLSVCSDQRLVQVSHSTIIKFPKKINRKASD